MTTNEELEKRIEILEKEVTHMYWTAITYGAVSLLLLGVFAYLTFRMTKK